MTRKERVMTAICHQTPDQVPTGEIHIQPELCSRLLGKEYPWIISILNGMLQCARCWIWMW